jgi:hypothetical protein
VVVPQVKAATPRINPRILYIQMVSAVSR